MPHVWALVVHVTFGSSLTQSWSAFLTLAGTDVRLDGKW